ncbi:flagellar protein FlaG [Brevibacillus agri]|uniref:flagellar protein FlaG n=1 Tax=Brevibacillus agri TaxID=51101 RepID=UPI002E23DA32|nr:flagellar protein FlaG [Brevibacillus agri]
MDVNLNVQPGKVKAMGMSSQVNGSQAQSDGLLEGEVYSRNNVSEKELEKVVNNLKKWVQHTQSTHLQFRLHEKLNEYYVEVVNDQTKEVIREIPSKKILDVAAKMQEMIGLLVDEKR